MTEKERTENIRIIYQYIESNIEKECKAPRSFIHYPFLDPGSVYDGNVWDWDTYWSVYGALPMKKRFQNGRLEKTLTECAKGNVRNFLDWQLDDGYIPMMIEVSKWPEPYLNIQHKNHHLMNMHKPFLCQQICLISDDIGDYGWIVQDWEKIERYLRYYKKTYFNENAGLYVWHDDIMIGMDNDPASFGRPEDSTANIFLNSFMVMELKAAADYFEKVETYLLEQGDGDKADRVREDRFRVSGERDALIRAIHSGMYDKRDGFFYSQDVDVRTRPYDWFHKGLGVFWKTLPIRIAVWSGFLPMLAGIATREEASHLMSWYHNEEAFGSPYGIPTLDRREKMFRIEATNNPSDWLGPIWLVANYCVFRGMKNYGYEREAGEMAEKSIALLARDIRKHGCLHEYYDPDSGEPVMNGGFINWNILALNMASEMGWDF